MSQPHRIRTLRLDLRAAQPDEAFRLRQAVAATVQSVGFAGDLETLLDRLAPDGTEYRIDRLEVPLSGLTTEAWEREGTARLLAALESALTRKLASATGAAEDVSEKPNVPGLQTRSVRETALDALVQFLITGTMPWWVEPGTWEAVLREALRQHPERVGARLASALAQPEAARRLVWQFSPKTVREVLEALAGSDAVGHLRRREAALVRRFRVLKKPPERLRDTVEASRVAWLIALAAQNGRADAAWLEAETRREEQAGVGNFTISLTPPTDSRRDDPPPEFRPRIRTDESGKPGPQTGSVPEQPESKHDFPGQKNLTAAPEPVVFPKTALAQFITNAGLVLLHPFIAPLLSELGFLENGRFRSENHQHRAVHLRAHLLGQWRFSAERSLLLPKLLLGLPPEQPLRRRVRLSRTEKNEARNLLEAVIEHWTVLRNTSPGALQAEFLQREGRLERRDVDWFLTVEQRASDVLLGRLPWGISMVRLPWMEGWLHVTWS